MTETLPEARPDPTTPNIPGSILTAAILFGLLCGAHEIVNTSIGWHIGSGRWMFQHREVLDHDPFSFTADGAEWIDHEWLFQILAAGLHDLGGPALLVVMRMLVIAALTVLLLRIGTSSGLDPPIALLLATLCVWGARPRFFLRPELFTLLLVPLALWLFSSRDQRRLWPLPMLGVVALGANLHGAILVVPILVAAWFAGEILEGVTRRELDRPRLISGTAGFAAAALAPLANPHGWAIYAVPFRLAEMVRQPHIPNPEWISPGPTDAPALYVAIAFACLVLLLGRALQSWPPLLAITALALRHIRNIGLFFVLLPQVVAPTLARWDLFAAGSPAAVEHLRFRRISCLALVAILAATVVLSPWPRTGFDFAEGWYPDRAYAFAGEHHLLEGRLYNDVRFGGWLILNGYPDHRVFLDDRNEIHEPLLEEIWRIFNRSDVGGWEKLLDRWQINTVLLRYHEPLRVTTPDGTDLGRRGFSTLWFRPERWALVYWDDVAMVIIRRESASGALLASRANTILHPDDLEYLMDRLAREPELRPAVRRELERALADDPECRRARELEIYLRSLDSR